MTASPHGESPDRPTLVELRTTFPDRDTAVACAERLVRDGVAACVQVDGPVASVYAWRGAVERAEEWRCTCKTTVAGEAACLRGIAALHDYENPELIVMRVSASPAYAAWVRSHVDGR